MCGMQSVKDSQHILLLRGNSVSEVQTQPIVIYIRVFQSVTIVAGSILVQTTFVYTLVMWHIVYVPIPSI